MVLEAEREEVREVGGAAFVGGLAGVVADEEIELDLEQLGGLAAQPAGVGEGRGEPQLDRPGLLGPAEERGGEHARPGDGDHDEVAGLNVAHRLVRRTKAPLVLFPPIQIWQRGVHYAEATAFCQCERAFHFANAVHLPVNKRPYLALDAFPACG